MVAAKDVSMEPTIKSLNEDLVRSGDKVIILCWFCCTFNIKHLVIVERSS